MANREETPLSAWGDVPNLRRGAGLYTTAFVWILAGVLLPVLLAGIFNKQGWLDANIIIAILVGIVDMFVVGNPLTWAVVAAVGYAYRQIGGRPGPSIQDGMEGAQEAVRWGYKLLTTIMLVRLLVIVAFGLIPVVGNGSYIAWMVVCVPPVILGHVVYSRKTWVGEEVYKFFKSTLWITGIYLVLIVLAPEFRVEALLDRAGFVATREIDKQVLKWKKKEEIRITGLLTEMPDHLTEAERIDKLTPKDREIWNKVTKGFTRAQLAAIKDKVVPAVKLTASEVSAAASGLAGSSSAAVACKASYSVSYNPGKEEGSLEVGTMCPGKYRFVVTGERQQAFFETTMNRKLIWTSACGLLKDRSAPWIAPASMGHPLPEEPFGATLIQVGTEFMPICREEHKVITLKDPTKLTVTLNVPRFAANFGAAPRDKDGNKTGPAAEGSLEVRIVPDRAGK